MVEPSSEANPLGEQTPDELTRMYNGKKQIPKTDIPIILGNFDKVRLSEYLDELLSDDAFESIRKELATWGATVRSAEDCADIMEALLKAIITGEKVFCSAPRSLSPRNLPVHNQFFAGRQKMLADLHANFFEQDKQIQVIAGLGGVGKTQTAWQYAFLNRDKYPDAIWCINADSSLISDIKNLLLHFGFPENDHDESHIQHFLHNWYQQYGFWLLIFDNAENYDALEPYLPKMAAKGHVIITTRNSELSRKIKPIIMDVFTENESLEFLALHSIPSDDDAKALANLLGHLPLALEQAAAYIQHEKSCKKYIRRLENNGLQILEEGQPPDYDFVVTTVWQITFEKLSEAARELMYLCAYLPSDRIPINLFVDGKDHLPELLKTQFINERRRDKVVNELLKYSLLKVTDADKDIYSLHALLQAVILNEDDSPIHLQPCFDIVLWILSAEFDIEKDSKLFKLYFLSCYHVLALTSVMSSDNHKVFEILARAFDRLGRLSFRNGMYANALDSFEFACAIYEDELPRNNVSIGNTLADIASLYMVLNRYEDALETSKDALTYLESSEKSDKSRITWLSWQIANAYARNGETDKAFELYGDLAEDMETESFISIPPLRKSAMIHNYGNLLEESGDYSGALWMFEYALSIAVASGDEDKFELLSLHSSLGNIYRRIGDFKRSREAYQYAIDLCEKHLGEHPETAFAYNGLASLLRHEGLYEEAKQYSEKALRIQKELLGATHLDTLSTLKGLAATLYSGFEEYKIADDMLLEVYEGYQKVFKMDKPEEKHVDAIFIYILHGELNIKRKIFSAAHYDLMRACDCCMELFGLKHTYTAQAFFLIGQIHEEIDELEDALSAYVWSYASRLVTFGSNLETQVLGGHIKDIYQSLNGEGADFDGWMSEELVRLGVLEKGKRLTFLELDLEENEQR